MNGFLKVYDFKEKIGKGGAVLEGFKKADAEYICFADVDCAVPPSEIKKLYQNIGNNDCIIGSRHLPESKIFIQQSIQRQFAGKTFNYLCRKLFGLPLRDTQCGGKVFKRKVIHSVIDNIIDKGWAFDVDLLVSIYKNGYSIKEYPINWYHDDNSKVKLFSDGIKMLISILKLKVANKKQNFKQILFLQHHYVGQGTYIRSINLAQNIAHQKLHILVTGINDKINFFPQYHSLDENPYVTVIKLPRFFQQNSPLDLLFRLPFAIWITIKQRYTLLYAFALGMPTSSIPTLVYKVLRRSDIIVDWDDLWHNGYGKYTGRWGNFLFYLFEIFSLKFIRPNYATSVSKFLKNQFISNGLDQSRIHIIGNGVGQEKKISHKNKELLKERYNISTSKKVLISVGNTYGKSFGNLISAFKTASQKDQTLELYLLGNFIKSGQIGKEIEDVIKNNRELFLSKIKILGLLPYEEYTNFLSLADVAILPMEDSNIDRARFPIRLGDYIKYQLPIVSNATGVVEEILKKYEYGLICDVKDIQQFAQNIIICANETQSYMSKDKADIILKKELDWSVHSSNLNKIFENLLSNNINA